MLTILLEDHSSSATARYIDFNRPYLANSIIALEACAASAEDWQPLNLEEVEAKSDSIKVLFPVLFEGQLIYGIDNLFCDRDVDQLLDGLAENRGVRLSFYDRLFWVRDQVMAKYLSILMLKHQQRNIITIVGALHYGIIYHLLYLLPHLQTQIRMVALCDYKTQSPGCSHQRFYFQQLPVPIVTVDDLQRDPSLCQLDRLRALPITPTCPGRLEKFKLHYESCDSDYKLIRKKIEEITQVATQLLAGAHSGVLSDAQQSPILQTLYRQIYDFSQMILPRHDTQNLLGCELFSKPLVKTLPTPISYGVPGSFITRYWTA